MQKPSLCMHERTESNLPELLWALGFCLCTTLMFPFPLKAKTKEEMKMEKPKNTPPPKNPDGPFDRFKAFILYLHGKEDIELLTPIARGQGGLESIKGQPGLG